MDDFGTPLPGAPLPPPPHRRERLFRHVPARGARRHGAGWSPNRAPVAQYTMTSDQLPVLWPFIAGPALPPTGAQMGFDEQSGASFFADPLGWVLDDRIAVTNPNIVCMGAPGTGKSATTKAFCLRMTDFGYRILVLGDRKDEYEPLCRFFGVEPFALGPGMPWRINPLSFGPLAHGWADLSPAEAQARASVVFTRWLTLVRGLVGSQKVGDRPVPFGPNEEVVVRAALEDLTGYSRGGSQLTETTVPQLWQVLDDPPDHLVASCRFDSRRDFLDQTRLLRNALGKLVSGVLAGIFDEKTNIQVDWAAPIQSLSLSRLDTLGDEAVGTALMVLNSWGRGMREMAEPGDRRVVVRDEVWKIMRLGLAAVMSLDEDFRLSRGGAQATHGAAEGADIQWINAHKPSDMLTVGDHGSQAVAVAKDLIHMASTKVLHGQEPRIADELGALMGLGPMAVDAVGRWANQRVGRALWTVGDGRYKVQTVLHPVERQLFYTNEGVAA